jgi:hypothetical protein
LTRKPTLPDSALGLEQGLRHGIGSGQSIGFGAHEFAVGSAQALGLKGPGHAVLALNDDTLTVRTMAQALERVRALARSYAPKDRVASEELIAERRQER